MTEPRAKLSPAATRPPRSRTISTKFCHGCEQSKTLEEFHRKARSPDGRQTRCADCIRAAMRAHQRANVQSNRDRSQRWLAENADRARERHLLDRHGVSLASYETALANQGGVCGICAQPPGAYRLCVDREQPGVLRGLLCKRCLTALVQLRRDPELCRRSAAYLECTTP